MRAAILERPGAIAIRDIPRPVPAAGEVLIKVKAGLTCGTDLKAYLRGHSLIPMPGLFGHEFSGVVVETGRGVRRFRRGDAVMGVHSAPCFSCRFCERKLYNLCLNLMETKVLGAYAEYLLLPRHVVAVNTFRKPPALSFQEAAFLEPLACVVHGMEKAGVRKGDSVLVIGAGPIGLLHLLLARSRGARVAITALEKDRLATALQLGAEAAFLPAETADRVQHMTGGMGADIVIECTGQPGIWEASVSYVRRGGTVLLFGGCRKGATVTFDTERLHYDEIRLAGSFHFSPADVKKAYRLLAEGRVKVKKLISGTCGLDGLTDVFARLSRGEGIKYAVLPSR